MLVVYYRTKDLNVHYWQNKIKGKLRYSIWRKPTFTVFRIDALNCTPSWHIPASEEDFEVISNALQFHSTRIAGLKKD